MSKCYPIDRHLQMRRNAKSSRILRHNSSRDPIEDTICVFFMRPAGMLVRPAGMLVRQVMRRAHTRHAGMAAVDHKGAFTMNSMARETFRIYMPLS
jgi:hypothetical protein